MTSSLVNGVGHCHDHLHQDDRRLDHQDHHRDDQHQDHQDDLRQDHQVRACQGQMDALVHQYLQDRDQVHLQEYDRCVHQRPDHQDDHP